MDYMQKLKNGYLKNARQFKQTFGVELRPYFDLVTGFDVIKFDDEFIKSGDGACSEKVKTDYGAGAVRLIEALIAI